MTRPVRSNEKLARINRPAAWGFARRCVLVLALLALLRVTGALLVPLVTAVILFLLLGPAAARLRQRGWPAVVCAGVLSIVPAAVLGAIGSMLAPTAGRALEGVAPSMSRIAGLLHPLALRSSGMGLSARWLEPRLAWNSDSVSAWLEANAGDALLSAASALMLLFFLLLARRPLLAGLVRAMPDLRSRRRFIAALHDAQDGVAAFIGVMGAMNLLLAMATGLALAALGLPQPVFWSTVAFVLVFIPYLGPIAVTALLLVAGLDAFGAAPAMVGPALAFLALHAVEANFISPWWMGNRLRIGRPALLVAVMAGSWAWGVAGGLLAVPVLIALAATVRRMPEWPVTRALLAAEGAPDDPATTPDKPPPSTFREARTVAHLPFARVRRMPNVGRAPRTMRIAFVTETYPPEINGVSLTVARAVEHLRARGHEVDLIRPCQAGEQRGADAGKHEWRSSGYPIPVYPEMRFGVARSSTLAERFQATRAELVHVATEGPLGWAAIQAARRLGLPATSDFRTNFHQYSRYYGIGWLEPVIAGYLRRLHNRTSRCFAPTQQTCRELRQAGFERVELSGRGVDTERFSPSRRDGSLRAKWGATDDTPVLLYVGRLAPEKNVELALLSFRNARRLVPAARMVVVGEGPIGRRVERENPDVVFAGMQSGDALAAHYASADLFLFPSLSETFGNVTLEALASGLPVVAYDVAAASEHVIDQVNGRTIPPGSRPAFVVASCLMTIRFRELGPMREAARRTAVALGWDKVLRGFEQQLVETVDGPARAAARSACTA